MGVLLLHLCALPTREAVGRSRVFGISGGELPAESVPVPGYVPCCGPGAIVASPTIFSNAMQSGAYPVTAGQSHTWVQKPAKRATSLVGLD